MQALERCIINTKVNTTNYVDACNCIQSWADRQISCYVIAANVHVVMTAYWNRSFNTVVNNAALVTPDGMPLVWALRLLGVSNQPRVYGPDLMLSLCKRAAQYQIPIYLYGGTQAMLDKLSSTLAQKFPKLDIAGAYSPPFRSLSPAEELADIDRIHQSGAKIVFVGLGCPKQELWMSRQQGQLDAVMIGVGAAFAFHSSEVSQAPRWMMRLGCEWLYRFFQEPRRLWQRYLLNNPMFLILFIVQLLQVYVGLAQASDEKKL